MSSSADMSTLSNPGGNPLADMRARDEQQRTAAAVASQLLLVVQAQNAAITDLVKRVAALEAQTVLLRDTAFGEAYRDDRRD